MPTPAKYKKQYPVLREVDSLALANAQVYLIEPLKILSGKRDGLSKKKKKRNGAFLHYEQSTWHGQNFDNRYLKVPKLKSLIKMKVHRQPLGR